MVPRLRVWRWPMLWIASCISGNFLATRSENSRSRWRVIAPTSIAVGGVADIGQALDPVEVDDVVGLHEAEVEHRHQRLAAGQQLGVLQR